MKLNEAIEEVKRIAKRCAYEGDLSENALKECAEVYLANCDEDGTPSPRRYMRSGDSHKPTHLSEILWLVVRTDSFRKWFGNSVVVDENGDPKVMYHGTWKSFTEYKPSAIRLSKVAMTLWSGPGFYFTDDEKVAKIYAGENGNNIYEVFLRLEKPLIVDESGNAADGEGITKRQAERIFLEGDNTQWLDSGLANELARMDEAEGVKGKGKHYYKGISRQQRVMLYIARLKTDVVMLKTAALAYGAKSQQKLLAAICRHTGYDGIIHTITPEVKEWVVYEPTAIKSATGNNGDFSTATAKVEDSAVTKKVAEDGLGEEEFQEKGTNNMAFKSLIDSLTKMVGNPAEVHEEGMDIVDRHGRHHQPKAIPEGGQYEEEGQYAASATAKEEWFHKTFAENKKPEMKKMRDFCADILSRIDSSKIGNDTAVSDYKKQIHKYADMPKSAVITGMKTAWNDMKTHADTYNEIKGMAKEEFAGWLKNHPEYNSPQMQKLMTNKAYGKTYKIKNAEGEYEAQDHVAWEEAKMMVARKAVASMIDYMAHTEALHNTPDALIDSFLKGKGKGEKHKSGLEDYSNTHGIKHGEGETAQNVTMSEINAVESEMAKAIEDAKTDTAKTAYFHALSHFLGKDGGLRDPNVTKEDVLKKASKRIIEKENALKDAAANGDKNLYNAALADFEATEKAAQLLGKALDVPNAKLGEILFKTKHPDVPGETAKEIGKNVPSEQTVKKPDEPKQVEEKKGLTEAGKKFKNGLGDFLNSDNGKKLESLAAKVLKPEEVDEHKKSIEANSIAKNKSLMDDFQKQAKDSMINGDKNAAKIAWAKYHMTAKRIFDQLSGFDGE